MGKEARSVGGEERKERKWGIQLGGVEEVNRSFPSPCLPPLQSESKCEVFE